MYAGIICIIAAVILSFADNLLTGLSIAPSAIILLVLAEHLHNQERIIEAIQATACPQMFYITSFAPDLIKFFLAKYAPEFADADVSFDPPVLATDGSFIIKGHTYLKYRPKNFEMAFIPGVSYHRRNDWQLTYFRWL